MAPGNPASRRGVDGERTLSSRLRLPSAGPAAAAFLAFLSLATVPTASAHGATATGLLSRWHGAGLALLGAALLGAAVLAKRTDRLSPTTALAGVFAGIVVLVVGIVLFDGLSPDPEFTAASFPFPRAWYAPLALTIGLAIAVVSFVVGWLRWPERPRYALLGALLGLWVSYPYLIPGQASDTHPLGYAIVLTTPLAVGYVVWRDAGAVLREVYRDPVARLFGAGVGLVVALFFLALTGYLSFFPEEGVPHERVVAVLPVIYQLVTWPTLEIYLPHVPLFLALSPGQLIVVATLSGLVGLNAAVVARHWRDEERASGAAQGTAGTAAIVGSCTCGCCGPLVAKVAVLAAGPSVAAPLYWVFVDTASPLSALFIAATVLLFVGSLLYSIGAAGSAGRVGESASVGAAD